MDSNAGKPKVSVLMTAYNSQAYIGLAIESILNQTFSDFEFLIVDDCSTDSTWQIISDYAKKDLRLKAFKNESNLGISKNRNQLINLVNTEFIAWQDADDISLPTRLADLFEFMVAHPKVGILGGYLQFFNEIQGDLSIRKYLLTDSEIRKKIFRFSPVAQPAAMVRVSALKKIGGFDENLSVAEDLDVSFKIGLNFEFVNLPKVLIKYRQQANSITFKKLKTLELNTLKIRRLFAFNAGYKISFFDLIYNLGQLITLYLMPAKLRVGLFNLIRNKKDE
ncbi:MAG: glycosyltransferase family 2 protein [Candidatus Buchananbacteria bacterium]